MEALHDVVRMGKVRYIGASSMFVWQFAQAQHVADLRRWTRFVSMQPHYNLLYREEEREMIPYCIDQGVGVIPWSPLARGVLAGNPHPRPAIGSPSGPTPTPSPTTSTRSRPTSTSSSGSPRSPRGSGSRRLRSRSPGCSAAGRHRTDRRCHQAAAPRRRAGGRAARARPTTTSPGSRSSTSPTRCSGTSDACRVPRRSTSTSTSCARTPTRRRCG